MRLRAALCVVLAFPIATAARAGIVPAGPHPIAQADGPAFEASPYNNELGWEIEPGSAPVGAPLSRQPRLLLVNGAAYNGPVTMSLVKGTGTPGAKLLGTTTVNAAKGEAQFTDLAINIVGRSYQLEAQTPSGANGFSSLFNVIGPPVGLAFSVSPNVSVAGRPIAGPPQVQISDVAGNPATGYSGLVTLTLKPGSPDSGSLVGETTSPVNGSIAFFPDAIINATGSAYVLTASATGLTAADSKPFAVLPLAHHVSPQGNDNDDGLTWATAKATLAGGGAGALPGQDVWVAAGKYTFSKAISGERVTTMPAGVSLYGGFAGTETSFEDRDPTSNVTTIDGTLSISGVSVYPATVDGVTIQNGTGVALLLDGDIFNPYSSYGVTRGAGIYVRSGDAIISNNVIKNNSNANLDWVTDYLGRGANVCTSENGGGIYCSSGHVTIEDNIFSNNTALEGTAVANGPSDISTAGTAIVTVARNLIVGNNGASTLFDVGKVLDNAIVTNIGTTAGAVNDQGLQPARVVNNTIVSNYGPTCFKLPAGSVVANNILYLNGYVSGVPGPSLLGVTDFSSNTRNNLFWNPGDPTNYGFIGINGNIKADPLFVGGADYHLRRGSPAIEHGNDADVPAGSLDLDRHQRIQSHHVDIGAYESYGFTATLADAITLMRITGGLTPAGAVLSPAPGRIGLVDAVTLARRQAGLSR